MERRVRVLPESTDADTDDNGNTYEDTYPDRDVNTNEDGNRYSDLDPHVGSDEHPNTDPDTNDDHDAAVRTFADPFTHTYSYLPTHTCRYFIPSTYLHITNASATSRI